MGLLLFPTGLLTPEDDGLFADWHEDIMLSVADLSAGIGTKYPNPAFTVTTWGLRGYVALDKHFFEPQPSLTNEKSGGVHYFATNG